MIHQYMGLSGYTPMLIHIGLYVLTLNLLYDPYHIKGKNLVVGSAIGGASGLVALYTLGTRWS